MSSDDYGEKMDKKSNQKQQSSVQRNYNELQRNQRSGRRRGNGSNGGNYSYSEGPSRKPTSQKHKNTWDKRPRPRSDQQPRGRSDLEVDDDTAEYGSAIQTGSKKGNLNHLLNFTYESRDTASYRGGNTGWNPGRHSRHRGDYLRGYYNKERFLQANCQFLVKKDGDYHVHLMDPDVLVDWDSVEQVRVTNTEEPSCPICLHYPKAGKMTRCGHIYCWACILHYLALGEKSWRKCPICYESVHSDDLKSVEVRQVSNYKVRDTITMTLMKKEKGSIYAVPASSWQKQPNKCHSITDSKEVTCYQKLLSITKEQVLDMIKDERDHLLIQQMDAEASEEPFIKGALEQLLARELGVKEVMEKYRKKSKPQKVPQEQQSDPIPVKLELKLQRSKKIKQYKDAFDNVVDEEEKQGKADQTAISDNSNTHISPTSTLEDNEPSSPPVDGRENSGGDGNEASPSSPTSPTGLEESFTVGSPDVKPLPPIELLTDGLPVEEAAEHLELPTQEERNDRSRNISGDNCFYFYQAEDGQNVYLHSLNARCLVKEYGSLQNSPHKITAEIVEKESGFVSDELRKRVRYLSHLPVTCNFDVAELILKPPLISKETLKYFADDIERRKRKRQKKSRDEKRMARKAEEHEKKRLGLSTGIHMKSEFYQHDRLSDTRSDTSSPTCDTPIGSPSGLNVNAAEFTPLGSSPKATADPEEGSQTTVISFAQMIRGGTQATVWPKAKTESREPVRSRQMSGSQHPGSDESDNEDRVPVPQFQDSFGCDIQAALENIEKKAKGTPQQNNKSSNCAVGGTSSGGKKKKKQLVLFSTSMARGGN